MNTRNIIADNYFGMIKNLSVDVKLELITRISESMKDFSQNEDKQKKKSWKLLFGAFDSEQSADEIIDELRKSRYTNRHIEDL